MVGHFGDIPVTQKLNIINIFRAAVKPSQLTVMLKKVVRRVFDSRGSLTEKENLAWLANNCSDFSIVASKLDLDLWNESRTFESELKTHANKVLAELDVDLGGGGYYPMIYFLVRHLKPETVVETGVAAGFSSSAALSAMKKNQSGKLLSSDFPYFRLPNPERYIGVVVADDLKKRWELFVEGDDANLPKIMEVVSSIDLLHYDSDKSYSGRETAIETLRSRFTDNTVLIMDDIQDNSFFYDYVKQCSDKPWYVFKFEGKYIGVFGEFESALSTSVSRLSEK